MYTNVAVSISGVEVHGGTEWNRLSDTGSERGGCCMQGHACVYLEGRIHRIATRAVAQFLEATAELDFALVVAVHLPARAHTQYSEVEHTDTQPECGTNDGKIH